MNVYVCIYVLVCLFKTGIEWNWRENLLSWKIKCQNISVSVCVGGRLWWEVWLNGSYVGSLDKHWKVNGNIFCWKMLSREWKLNLKKITKKKQCCIMLCRYIIRMLLISLIHFYVNWILMLSCYALLCWEFVSVCVCVGAWVGGCVFIFHNFHDNRLLT